MEEKQTDTYNVHCNIKSPGEHINSILHVTEVSEEKKGGTIKRNKK